MIGDGAMGVVLRRLDAALPTFTTATCERIYETLDSYSLIPPEALAAAVARNLRSALAALQQDRVPQPEELSGAAQTAQERFDAGVPVEEIVRAFRISISLIHEEFVDLGTTLGVPVAEVVGGSRILWGVADSFTTRIITEYHELALAAALHDSNQRVWLVRRLLAGDPMDDSALVALDTHARYAAVRCEVPQGDAEAVRRHLETTGSTSKVPAIVVADAHSCMGLVAQRPTDPGVAVGLGPFVSLDELPRSDRISRIALSLSLKLGRDGIQCRRELGWRLAAVSRPDVWHDYAERFLAPLEAEGRFGDDLRVAVLAWLRQQRSIPKAAASLHLHANTLRYRLQRYQDLVGSDLSEIDDVIGATWALELGHPDPTSL